MRMQCVLFVIGAIEMTINDADDADDDYDDDRCNFFLHFAAYSTALAAKKPYRKYLHSIVNNSCFVQSCRCPG